jgi:pyrroline-5-carboxylate reductase
MENPKMTEKIGFIGAGNMAHCIIGGMLKQGFKADSIWASDPSAASLDRLKSAYGIHTTENNSQLAAATDILFFSVKPQMLQNVCEQIGGQLKPGGLIISIAAGIPISSIENWIGDSASAGQAIVRCMPNTPAQVLKGATGMFANAQVSKEQKSITESLFAGIGLALWVETEHLLHAVTALSGSGPAYIFLVIEAMEAAAVKLGLPTTIARKLAAQTVAGAAELVQQSELEPAQLKRNVMSPGGTTERAIATFEQRDLMGIFEQAITAASARSEELAKLL